MVRMVSEADFQKELLEAEGVHVTFYSTNWELSSYVDLFPKRLKDEQPVGRLYRRLLEIMPSPKGWALCYGNGRTLNSRNVKMVTLRTGITKKGIVYA